MPPLIGPIVILYKLDGSPATHIAVYKDREDNVVQTPFHVMVDEGRMKANRKQAISTLIPLKNWIESRTI